MTSADHNTEICRFPGETDVQFLRRQSLFISREKCPEKDLFVFQVLANTVFLGYRYGSEIIDKVKTLCNGMGILPISSGDQVEEQDNHPDSSKDSQINSAKKNLVRTVSSTDLLPIPQSRFEKLICNASSSNFIWIDKLIDNLATKFNHPSTSFLSPTSQSISALLSQDSPTLNVISSLQPKASNHCIQQLQSLTSQSLTSKETNQSPQLNYHDSNQSPQLTCQDSNKSLQAISHDSDQSLQLNSHTSNQSPQLNSHDSNQSPQLTCQDSNQSLQAISHDSDQFLQLNSHNSNQSPQLNSHDSNQSPQLSCQDSNQSLQAISHDSNQSSKQFQSPKHQKLLEAFLEAGCYLRTNKNSYYTRHQLIEYALINNKLNYHLKMDSNPDELTHCCRIFSSSVLISDAKDRTRTSARRKAIQIAFDKLTKPHLKLVSLEGDMDELISSDFPFDDAVSKDRSSLKRLQSIEISEQLKAKVIKLASVEESGRANRVPSMSERFMEMHPSNDEEMNSQNIKKISDIIDNSVGSTESKLFPEPAKKDFSLHQFVSKEHSVFNHQSTLENFSNNANLDKFPVTDPLIHNMMFSKRNNYLSRPFQNLTLQSNNSHTSQYWNQRQEEFQPAEHQDLLDKLTILGSWLRMYYNSGISIKSFITVLTSAVAYSKLTYTWEKYSNPNCLTVVNNLVISNVLISSAEDRSKNKAKQKACQLAIDKLRKTYLKIESLNGGRYELISSDDVIQSDNPLKQFVKSNDLSDQPKQKVVNLENFEETKKVNPTPILEHFVPQLARYNYSKRKKNKINIDEALNLLNIMKKSCDNINNDETSPLTITSNAPSETLKSKNTFTPHSGDSDGLQSARCQPQTSLCLTNSNLSDMAFADYLQQSFQEKMATVDLIKQRNKITDPQLDFDKLIKEPCDKTYGCTYDMKQCNRSFICSIFCNSILIGQAKNKKQKRAQINAFNMAVMNIEKKNFEGILPIAGTSEAQVSSEKTPYFNSNKFKQPIRQPIKHLLQLLDFCMKEHGLTHSIDTQRNCDGSYTVSVFCNSKLISSIKTFRKIKAMRAACEESIEILKKSYQQIVTPTNSLEAIVSKNIKEEMSSYRTQEVILNSMQEVTLPSNKEEVASNNCMEQSILNSTCALTLNNSLVEVMPLNNSDPETVNCSTNSFPKETKSNDKRLCSTKQVSCTSKQTPHFRFNPSNDIKLCVQDLFKKKLNQDAFSSKNLILSKTSQLTSSVSPIGPSDVSHISPTPIYSQQYSTLGSVPLNNRTSCQIKHELVKSQFQSLYGKKEKKCEIVPIIDHEDLSLAQQTHIPLKNVTPSFSGVHGSFTQNQSAEIVTKKIDQFIIFEQGNEKLIDAYSILRQSAIFNKVNLIVKFDEKLQESQSLQRCSLLIDMELLIKADGATREEAKKNAAVLALKKLKAFRPTIRVKDNNNNGNNVVTHMELFGEQNKIEEYISDKNIGNKMLHKMGWTGGGLGKPGKNSIEEPIHNYRGFFCREGLGLKPKNNFRNNKSDGIVRDFIYKFKRNLQLDDLEFDYNFSKEEHKIIRKICQQLNLKTETIEKENNQVLIVCRKRTPQELLRNLIDYGGSTSKYELIRPKDETENKL